MREPVFDALYPFGGAGGFALGAAQCEVRVLGHEARLRTVGSIDFDAEACTDFELLTGAPAWCIDVEQITAPMLLERYGERAPHMVIFSPPCKAASGLISDAKAATEPYRRMNRLALVWVRVMLEAWGKDPPALLLLENVPRLKTRARAVLGKVKGLLRRAGYALHEGYHDCGEIGGLAQHRRRYLLIARHRVKCPRRVHRPPTKRVRACGEVLEQLPMPATRAALAAGPHHRLPRLSWLNWLRLALIPAGGDWRDLEGVLAEGQKRRDGIARWEAPTGAVAGPGSNGVGAISDPRGLALGCAPRAGAYGVGAWERPSPTIIGHANVDHGASIADPRIALPPSEERHWNKYAVGAWGDPARTVIGQTQPGSGGPAIADPRMRDRNWGGGTFGVTPWAEPAATVAGESRPSNGEFSVADPRLVPSERFNGALGVMPWADPSRTVIGGRTNGAVHIADPRLRRPGFDKAYGVLGWDDPAHTVAGTADVGCGAFSVADPRGTELVDAVVMTLDEAMSAPIDPDTKPEWVPIIIAADGTWHRPLTTLELAALQGFPAVLPDGRPLSLTGRSQSRHRERIGNAVPVGAGAAITRQALIALTASHLEANALGGATPVWVDRSVELDEEARW